MRNQKLPTILLILTITVAIISISTATLTETLKLKNFGRIQINKVLDTCDWIGNWHIISSKEPPNNGNNTIAVDTGDKVEGVASLRMTFAADGPNYGGCFYRESRPFDLRDTPVLRMRFKAHSQLPSGFKFAIRARGLWSGYNITKYVNVTGEWLIIDIDLRLPDYGENFPDLSDVTWLEFSTWELVSSSKSFSVDLIEAIAGPTIELNARIKSASAWTEVGVPITFKVDVKGGVQPYSYAWRVNETLQKGATSASFTYNPIQEGNFTIKCTITDAENSVVNVTTSLEAEVVSYPPPSPPSVDVFKSEIRGMYLDDWLYRNPNWTRIAETCLKYGINTIVIGVSVTELWNRTSGQVYFNQLLYQGVKTFQSYGFKVHILADICYNHVEGMTVTLSDGSTETWLCLTKNAIRQMWKAIMESLVRDYGIDGFMFDYIRWRTTQMCFCNECKAKFISDTGLTDVNWPTDCLEGGRYYWQFIQWRLNPITEFVRDAVQWMRAIKPDLVTSAAVFTAFDNCGNYWVMSIGQHVADWVDRGYLDFVSPMMYSKVASTVTMYLQNSLNFYTGGAEGKIPMVPFITFLDMSIDEYTPMPIQNFIDVVSALKQNGADGYIIYKYGGPGWENDPSLRKFADVRPHLAALIQAGLMQPVWAIQNFTVQVNGNYATISWTTTVPTNATIEYADGKIFYANVRYGDWDRPIYYKDINYNGTNSIKISNSTWSTTHSFIIPITPETEFRVQCSDAYGTKVTSTPVLISKYY